MAEANKRFGVRAHGGSPNGAAGRTDGMTTVLVSGRAHIPDPTQTVRLSPYTEENVMPSSVLRTPLPRDELPSSTDWQQK